MTFTLLGMAEHFAKVIEVMPEAEKAALEHAAKLVEAEAKRVIGTYDYGWPPLAAETVARKGADTPLLETGELRNSIEHVVHEHEAFVGSNDPVAKYQELGTSRGIPPRSFLAQAAIHKEKQIHEETGRVMYAALISGAVHIPMGGGE